MGKLLFETLLMVGLTFIIGFVVAAIIKVIAVGADYFEFHRIHREEIEARKRKRKAALQTLYQTADHELEEGHELWIESYHGVSRSTTGNDAHDQMMGWVSKGEDHYDILHYYYPKEAGEKGESGESANNNR